MRYTIEQRKFIVEEYLVHNRDLDPVGPLFRQKFGIPPPQKVSMLAIITKWNEKGTVQDQIKGVSGRQADVVTPENIEIVKEEFSNNPRQSLKLASQGLQISKTSIHVMLRKKLHWKPYKTQKRHKIPERCVLPRVTKTSSFISAFYEDPNLLNSIWFTDESHFELVPTLNSQNNRFWAPEQPYETIQTELHPQKTTAWGAISTQATKSHYSVIPIRNVTNAIVNPQGHSLLGIFLTFFDETVKQCNYVKMLQEEFIPFLHNNDILQHSYLMQDGATPHTCNATLDLLNQYFGERIVSGRYVERFGYGLSWPAYSPDLSPCDFFLWGYLKGRVYRNRPTTIDELKAEILRCGSEVPQDMLIRVMGNFKKRLEAVQVAQGRNIEHTPIMAEMRKKRNQF
ncbi:hypothetical protein Bhyg_03936 [Pseudolycoriella hygida]|uniref:Transposase n=1 Tax=Pseudolycoriella hygida TaxID=35572 RepID=A0A9Q0NE79_9DIPT|nr:hypothetical protein Bhyg_03936 [Pseudolycoriella hygida]